MSLKTEQSPQTKGIQVAVPFVVGNTAELLESDAPEHAKGHTHRWRVFVHGVSAKNDDLSFVVKKVVYRLHESFETPLRTVDRYPFEIEETGWGEFEIAVTIHLQDKIVCDPDTPRILKTFHNLRLHGFVEESGPVMPVLHESYDEIVINDPEHSFYTECLDYFTKIYPLDSKSWNKEVERIELEKLQAAAQIVTLQTAELFEKMCIKYDEICSMREECSLPPPSASLLAVLTFLRLRDKPS